MRKGTYVQGDITNLPFPDKTFDSMYCFDVLENVDDSEGEYLLHAYYSVLTVPHKWVVPETQHESVATLKRDSDVVR